MSVGEYTASSIAMDIDAKEDKEIERARPTDHDQLQADIIAAVEEVHQSSIHVVVDKLLTIEKQQRLAEDVVGTKLACTAILESLFAAQEWKLLNENILLLAKRRSQLKQAVVGFTRQAMGFIDRTPNRETEVELIKTLQTVTEGKIFVEIERARLTKRLAMIKEKEGNIEEAAAIIQEVAVETYGAMAKAEKIAFILEQVRLCLDKGDFVRAAILSKKISPKAFKGVKQGDQAGEIGIEGAMIEKPEDGTPSLSELKEKYYKLQIRYHAHSDAYLEICRCYLNLYESITETEPALEALQSPVPSPEDAPWKPILKKVVWYLVLAPVDSHRQSLMITTAEDPRLKELPLYSQLLKLFLKQEIMWWWKIKEEYESEVKTAEEVFGGKTGEKRQKDFQTRVTQHNLVVASKYYHRMSLSRLAILLDLPADQAEEALSDLVVSQTIYARIDRPSGVVRFKKPETAESKLNEWSSDIQKLLGILEKSCQQIQKEAMVHKLVIGKA